MLFVQYYLFVFYGESREKKSTLIWITFMIADSFQVHHNDMILYDIRYSSESGGNSVQTRFFVGYSIFFPVCIYLLGWMLQIYNIATLNFVCVRNTFEKWWYTYIITSNSCTVLCKNSFDHLVVSMLYKSNILNAFDETWKRVFFLLLTRFVNLHDARAWNGIYMLFFPCKVSILPLAFFFRTFWTFNDITSMNMWHMILCASHHVHKGKGMLCRRSTVRYTIGDTRTD